MGGDLRVLWSVEGLTEARAALASSSPALEGYLRWCVEGFSAVAGGCFEGGRLGGEWMMHASELH